MQYYAVGSKKQKGKDGEAWVNVRIPLSDDSDTRIKAVNQAQRIAKRDRINLEGVYPVVQTQKQGGVLTKGVEERKLAKR